MVVGQVEQPQALGREAGASLVQAPVEQARPGGLLRQPQSLGGAAQGFASRDDVVDVECGAARAG
jgi:hypothetical protein